MDENERAVADYARSKYHMSIAKIDALTDEEYDALCDKAVEDAEWLDRELFKLQAIQERHNVFIDWLMSHRP